MESTRLDVWISALMVIAVLSYLYKENPFYRLAEYTFMGLAVAHGVVITWHNTLVPYTDLHIRSNGWWWLWIAFAIGAVMYFQYAPGKLRLLVRLPISITVGWSLGYTLVVSPRPYVAQMVDTMRPLNSLDNALYFLMFACCSVYFFFLFGKNSRAVAGIGAWGRRIMMVAFGAAFGNIAQSRIALAIGRFNLLLGDWLGLIR